MDAETRRERRSGHRGEPDHQSAECPERDRTVDRDGRDSDRGHVEHPERDEDRCDRASA
jgi:hypothetical protein